MASSLELTPVHYKVNGHGEDEEEMAALGAGIRNLLEGRLMKWYHDVLRMESQGYGIEDFSKDVGEVVKSSYEPAGIGSEVGYWKRDEV